MSQGGRTAGIAAAASIVAAVLGAVLGRPVVNDITGTTDKIEQLVEENQALKTTNSELVTQVEALERAAQQANGEGEAGAAPAAAPAPLTPSGLASNLASARKAQVLVLGMKLNGSLAGNAAKEYVFVGTANTPLLFTLEQPSKSFQASVDVLDSQGVTVVKGEDFIQKKDEIVFTPPRNDAYVLKMAGKSDSGDYSILMSLRDPQ